MGGLLGLQRPLGPLRLLFGRGLGVGAGGMRLLGRPRCLRGGFLGPLARLVGALGGPQLLDSALICGRPLGSGGAGRLGRGGLCLLSLPGDPGPGLGHLLGLGQAGVGCSGFLRLGCGSLVGGLLGLEGGGGQGRRLQPGRLGVAAGGRGLLGGCRRLGQAGLRASADLEVSSASRACSAAENSAAARSPASAAAASSAVARAS